MLNKRMVDTQAIQCKGLGRDYNLGYFSIILPYACMACFTYGFDGVVPDDFVSTGPHSTYLHSWLAQQFCLVATTN